MRVFFVVAMAIACATFLSAQNKNSGDLDARRAQLRDALQAEWEYQLRTYPELAT
jgi:hypothetical protein